MKRWANGQRFTLRELRQFYSLRIAGCRHTLPLFGSWLDGDVWRVRCRLDNVQGKAVRYRPPASIYGKGN